MSNWIATTLFALAALAAAVLAALFVRDFERWVYWPRRGSHPWLWLVLTALCCAAVSYLAP